MARINSNLVPLQDAWGSLGAATARVRAGRAMDKELLDENNRRHLWAASPGPRDKSIVFTLEFISRERENELFLPYPIFSRFLPDFTLPEKRRFL